MNHHQLILLYRLKVLISLQLVSRSTLSLMMCSHSYLYLLTGGGVDYNSVLYNVTFPAGVINVSFNVTVINDTVLETNETFNLTIVGNSLPTNVTLGKIDQTTVTIVNDGGSRKYAIN